MHPIEQLIYKWMSSPAHRFDFEGQSIIVGCSAGPDSMALLHILHEIANHLSLTLIPTYVDHGLRPIEVLAERELFKETTQQLELTCNIVAIDVTATASQQKKSIEHVARELRYQVLRDVKEQYQAAYIAVGHHADDQVEEIFMRFLRGSSRKALSGMQRISGDDGEIIRPLLECSKQQISSYLGDKQITYCYDTSNSDAAFLRNRIRNELLPHLEKEYDPGIRKALLKTASNLQQDEDFLARLVQEMAKQVVLSMNKGVRGENQLTLDRTLLKNYHPALQRRFIEMMLWELESPAKYEHILAIIELLNASKSGQELHLTRGLRVTFSRDQVEFSYPKGKVSWRGKALKYNNTLI